MQKILSLSRVGSVTSSTNELQKMDTSNIDVDSPIRQSLRHYWVQNAQTDLTDTTFYAKSLPPIQIGAGNTPINKKGTHNADKTFNRTPRKSRYTANLFNTDNTTSKLRS